MNVRWEPRVVAADLGFPEGPVALADGRLTFTDIHRGCVSVVEDGAVHELARTGGGPNGATLGGDDALYVANNGGLSVGPDGYWHAPDPADGSIQRVGLDGTVSSVVAPMLGDAPSRPNDLCFGPDGALYVTDPRNWDDLANLLPGRIWRVDVAGARAEPVAEVPGFCNGIGFGPDGRLYVARSIAMQVAVFDVGPSGLGPMREHASLPAGFPDGFCFTADGRLIVCGSMGNVIQVFDPDGTLMQTIETGDHSEPTNCCIADGTLYVTLSGAHTVVATPIDAEPLPLYPFRP